MSELLTLNISDIFVSLALLLALATGVGLVANWLKQPLIIAFIAVGILASPGVFDLFSHSESVGLLSEVGICILLFAVGLKLDFSMIKEMGPVALATGLGQVIFTSLFGYLICMGLGFDQISSVYIAVALTFSSTIIIVKLLSDKREIDSLHGRIAVGFLIVQDILVILVMIALSSLGDGVQESPGLQAAGVFLRGLVLMATVFAIGRWVLPKAFEIIAKKPELLTLSAVCWAVLAATLSDQLGLSKEVGAFVGGVSIASSHFRESIANRLVSLRDFLLLFFFVHLGTSLNFSNLTDPILPAVILSLFVLIGNPIIVLVIMGLMGYRKRTGFLAGLTVAQISEFSFILAALGARIGHIHEGIVGLITLVGVITIGLSTYLIIYSHPLYEKISGLLSIFERKAPYAENGKFINESPRAFEYLIFGCGRMGQEIMRALKAKGKSYLCVDFDPQEVKKLKARGEPIIYGDAEDPELLSHLPHSQIKWVVSTPPDSSLNHGLIKCLKAHDYQGKLALTVARPSQIEEFKKLGADEVFCPPKDIGVYASEKIL